MTMRSVRVLAGVCAMAFASVACESMQGKFPAMTTLPETPEEVARAAMLDGMAWEPFRLRVNAGTGVESIEVVEDTIYVVDSEDNVHALDLERGTYRWMLRLERRPTRPVMSGPGVVGFLARNHLTVVTRDTGSRLLQTNLAFTPSSNGVVTRHSFYAGSWGNNYRLRSVSMDDGWNGWFFPVDAPITGAPVLRGAGADASVIFATQGGMVGAVPARPSTAAAPADAQWMYQTLGTDSADLVLANDVVYVASEDRALYALDAAAGSVRWKWFGDDPLTQAPVVALDAVYQQVPGGIVVLNQADGSERYRAADATEFLTRIGQRDYFLHEDGTVHVVLATTGEELAVVSSPLLDAVVPAPSAGLFLFSTGDAVYALN